MKRTGIDKICTYLEEKKISVEEVIRIAFYAGNLEGNKEIIVADEEAEMSLVADVSEDVIRASHNQHNLFDWWDVVENPYFVTHQLYAIRRQRLLKESAVLSQANLMNYMREAL